MTANVSQARGRPEHTDRSHSPEAPVWSSGENGEERVSIGSLLDRFADDSPLRRRLAHTEQRDQIETILARAGAEIERTLEEGGDDG